METPKNPTDARRHPRTSVSFLVDVMSYSAGLTTQDEGRLAVLSSGGGAVMELSGSYAVRSMLRLGFKLPSTTTAISCMAIVRTRLNTHGVGVEFLHLEPRDRKKISTFVLDRLSE